MTTKENKSKAGKAVKNRKVSDSDALLDRARSMMTRRLPMIVKNISEPKMVVLTPRQMAEIKVDEERYQRARSVEEVNMLIQVLRQGGMIPDPVTLSRRPDGSLWVVDGQQRFWAHFETESPMRALIYDVPDIAAERLLFITMNSQQAVTANTKVHAWPGPVATYLRGLNEDPTGPFGGKINFGKHHSRPFAAAPLVKALLASMAGLTSLSIPANELLRRADVAWNSDTMVRDRARTIMTVFAEIFGPDEGQVSRVHARTMPMICVALTGYLRWQKRIEMPSGHVIHLLRRINWTTIVPSQAQRFMPVLRSEIERRWRS